MRNLLPTGKKMRMMDDTVAGTGYCTLRPIPITHALERLNPQGHTLPMGTYKDKDSPHGNL